MLTYTLQVSVPQAAVPSLLSACCPAPSAQSAQKSVSQLNWLQHGLNAPWTRGLERAGKGWKGLERQTPGLQLKVTAGFMLGFYSTRSLCLEDIKTKALFCWAKLRQLLHAVASWGWKFKLFVSWSQRSDMSELELSLLAVTSSITSLRGKSVSCHDHSLLSSHPRKKFQLLAHWGLCRSLFVEVVSPPPLPWFVPVFFSAIFPLIVMVMDSIVRDQNGQPTLLMKMRSPRGEKTTTRGFAYIQSGRIFIHWTGGLKNTLWHLKQLFKPSCKNCVFAALLSDFPPQFIHRYDSPLRTCTSVRLILLLLFSGWGVCSRLP